MQKSIPYCVGFCITSSLALQELTGNQKEGELGSIHFFWPAISICSGLFLFVCLMWKLEKFVLMTNSFHMTFFPVAPFKHPLTSLVSNRREMSCSAEVPSKQRSPWQFSEQANWHCCICRSAKGSSALLPQVSSARDICKGQASALTSVNFLEGTKSALTFCCHGELPLLKLFLYLSTSSYAGVLSNRIPLLRAEAQSGQLHFSKGVTILNRQEKLFCTAEIYQGQCKSSGSFKPVSS